MRNSIGDAGVTVPPYQIPASAFSSAPASSGGGFFSGFNFNSLLDDVSKVLPTVLNHNATNQYGMQPGQYINPSQYPGATQYAGSGYYPGSTMYNQPQTGMSMGTILLLGGGALLAYKLFKKKR